MAFLLGCESACLEYPTKTIFDDVTLGVHEGDRIGIVGQNGDGKSTLLGVLAGEIELDSGLVRRTHNLRIGILKQMDALSEDDTVKHAVVGDLPEYLWAGDARIREVISELMGGISWDACISSLSGGQRRRADLARLLIGDWDILMLDEPTNHLDMRTISWLAKHLRKRWPQGQGALLVVTHDRWFLDELALGMWEVHDGKVEPFEGGYSAYILQRVERERVAQVAEQRRKSLARKELAWLSRGARARSTKPKFHVARAIELIEGEPPARNTLELRATAMQRLGKRVVELSGVSEIFDGHTVIDNIDWMIGPGDRYGILGENGAGKTTLLKIIQGSLKPTSGFVKIGKTVKFAVLSQRLDELEELGKYRVTEVLSRYRGRVVVDGKETTPAKLLERLGFSSKHLYTRVCDLSGGQKRRLQLLLILLDEPNVLILDEPGNDMDTDMLAVLEDLLDTWAGTLVMVTHDRYLMERVTDDQFALIDGKLRHVPRGVDEYLEMLDERDASGSTFAELTGQSSSESSNAKSASKSAASQDSSALSTLSNAEIRDLKKRRGSLEKRIATASKRVEEKQHQMDTADPSDFVTLGKLQGELDELKAAQEALEDEWLEVADILSDL